MKRFLLSLGYVLALVSIGNADDKPCERPYEGSSYAELNASEGIIILKQLFPKDCVVIPSDAATVNRYYVSCPKILKLYVVELCGGKIHSFYSVK